MKATLIDTIVSWFFIAGGLTVTMLAAGSTFAQVA
jgi:hypothetical protein